MLWGVAEYVLHNHPTCTSPSPPPAPPQVWGRYEATGSLVAGTYGVEIGGEQDAEVATVQGMAAAFEKRVGRRPRILIAKMGMDGHDRGARVMASG